MHVFLIIVAAVVATSYIWLILKLKLRDIDRRIKRDAPTQLHLND